MKSFTLDELVYEGLKSQPGKRIAGRELGVWIFTHYREWCEAKRQRSKATISPLDTDEKLINQIAGEIGARHSTTLKKYPTLKTAGTKPRRFYFSEQTDEQELAQAEAVTTPSPVDDPTAPAAPQLRLLEKDLYPLLAQYLIDELKVWSLRIDETKSSNRQGPSGNKWLFPDLVGLEDLTKDWSESVLDCVATQAVPRTKLWSFEVKLVINRSNVREVFFQAVSNSSWANLAYLVASQINGDETMQELQRLSSLHGVGVLLLNTEVPADSYLEIPALERTNVDWNTASRIAKENPDFNRYIELITKYYKLGDKNRLDERDWLACPMAP